MFTSFVHTWDSIKAHFEKLFSHVNAGLELVREDALSEVQKLREEMHAEMLALRAEIGKLVDRGVAVQVKENPTPQTTFGAMPPQSGGPVVTYSIPEDTHVNP